MLGPRIAALRKSGGFSQAELAQRLKISPSAVGMYEQGRREPPLQTLVDLARIFGVSTDYLLTGRPQPASDGAVVENAILSSLTAAEKQMAKRKTPPFSRDELVVMFAALLLEP